MCNTVLWTPMPNSLVVSINFLAAGMSFHNVLYALYCCHAELHTKEHWFGIGIRLINQKFSQLKAALSGHLITIAIFTYAKTTPYLRPAYAKNDLRFPLRVLIKIWGGDDY